MQTNSPPKLDTTKHTCIFHYHKQSKYLPLKVYKQDSHPHMQTNSPPKLDTTKHICIFHYHKQSKYLFFKVYKQDSHPHFI